MRRFPFILLVLALVLPLGALAQTSGGITPLADYSNTTLQQVFSGSSSLCTYVSNIFLIFISVGAILAVIMIVYGGYLYMGSDMWASKQKAKTTIADAIIGLLLLLGIYLILYQIDPQMLQCSILNDFQSSGTYQNTGSTVI